MPRKKRPRKEMRHYRTWFCHLCDKCETEDFRVVRAHLVEAHGYTDEQVGKASGGLKMALDGDEGFYRNNYVYADAEGKPILVRVDEGGMVAVEEKGVLTDG